MSKVIDVLKCTCPKCKEAKMFQTNGNVFLLKIPKMYERCPGCDFKFEKETGFFFGAMFVSYGLAVAEMIASLILFWLFLDVSPFIVFLIIATIALFAGTFNFRVSRSVWVYLFYTE